jgi:ABC-type thiamin/hydroxymethylpyrimidine transport system permease subunit
MIAQKKTIRAKYSKPVVENFSSAGQGVYYRLIALWVFCEAMIGGVIHGLRLPVSGMVVGSSAVICISLIAWFYPRKGAIIRATVIVAIFKMLLSPQAGFPAYIAVFFQGALGELVFTRRRHFFISAMTLSVLALLESGLQRILVLTIVYGNDLWLVINEFLNGLTGRDRFTNYSLWIGGSYLGVHALTGVLIGWFAGRLPGKIEQIQADNRYTIRTDEEPLNISGRKKKKNLWLKITWIMLLVIFLQSELPVGQPLLPSNRVVSILIRSLVIMLGWVIIIGPLLDHLLKSWLGKKQSVLQPALHSIRQALPAIQSIFYSSWKRSAEKRGPRRLLLFARYVIVNVVRTITQVHILAGPIRSGKTTYLI